MFSPKHLFSRPTISLFVCFLFPLWSFSHAAFLVCLTPLSFLKFPWELQTSQTSIIKAIQCCLQINLLQPISSSRKQRPYGRPLIGLKEDVLLFDLTCIPRRWEIFFLIKIFKNLIFNWRIIALQYHVGFCHTSTWISHRYTNVPSLLNLLPTSHPIPPF